MKFIASIIIGGALSILYGFPEMLDQLSFIKAFILGSFAAIFFFTLSHGEDLIARLLFLIISRGMSLNTQDYILKEIEKLNKGKSRGHEENPNESKK